jgi:hypothetical protein
MPHPAVAGLEAALRSRKLDRTLTTALPSGWAAPSALAPVDLPVLDDCLRGGLPRGALSELAGPRSSGRTSLLLQLVAAATRRGEIAALIDASDRLDVASAAAAGVDLDRLLWIRGRAGTGMPGTGQWPPAPASQHGVRMAERALKALDLVLQAGGFGVVALDLADMPPGLIRRLPWTTWLRIERAIEDSEMVCVLVVAEPVARSANGLTLSLAASPVWAGTSERDRFLSGTDVRVRVVSPRRRVGGEVVIKSQIPNPKSQQDPNPKPQIPANYEFQTRDAVTLRHAQGRPEPRRGTSGSPRAHLPAGR